MTNPILDRTQVSSATIYNQGAWSSTVSYQPNDIVDLSGFFYLCILANTNQTPPNALYWTEISGVAFSDTEQNILATTPIIDKEAIGYTTDGLYYLYVYKVSEASWFRSILPFGKKSPNPDIGALQTANPFEIYIDSIGHKTFAYCYIGNAHDAASASPTQAAIKADGSQLYVNFGSGWLSITIGSTQKYINGQWCVQQGNYWLNRFGNSVQYVDTGLPALGLNGVPIVQNWTYVSIGAYPIAIPLAGGTF